MCELDAFKRPEFGRSIVRFVPHENALFTLDGCKVNCNSSS